MGTLETAAAAEPAPGGEEPIESLMARGDMHGSMQAYLRMRARGEQPDLDPELELRLADVLELGGHLDDAAFACRRAFDKAPQGPLAARALFTAGRILTEKAGKPEQGKAVFSYLVDNYPTDPLAKKASLLLSRL
ncbi:MAG: hypothetical protein JXR96_02505 [Deltaproteobacteria bacterium]|nr:hypothetical protein [Deltaproteobacteria bacterium]